MHFLGGLVSSQGNYIFLGSFILALKKIMGPQGNSKCPFIFTKESDNSIYGLLQKRPIHVIYITICLTITNNKSNSTRLRKSNPLFLKFVM
jgi:hypothetical protein